MGIFSFVKAGGKKFGSIVGTGPKVNKTKLDKAKSELAKSRQKLKGSTAKLKQTQFEIKNKLPLTFGKSSKKTMSNTERAQKAELRKKEKKQENKTKHFYAPENFNKGGRVGLRFGSKKSNVQKIKETFGPKKNNPKMSKAKKKKFPDLTGDGKVTFADILKGRGVINGKKKGKA